MSFRTTETKVDTFGHNSLVLVIQTEHINTNMPSVKQSGGQLMICSFAASGPKYLVVRVKNLLIGMQSPLDLNVKMMNVTDEAW